MRSPSVCDSLRSLQPHQRGDYTIRWRIALLSLVLVVPACAEDGADLASSETTTTTTTTQATTTTTPPTTTTTVAPTTTLDEWEAIKQWRGGLAGEYRAGNFEPAFKFTTTSAFQPAGPTCGEAVSIFKSGSGVYFFNLGRGTVEETQASITELEGVSFDEPEEVDVGLASGVRLAGEANASPVVARVCDGAVFGLEQGADITVYIVDVAGETATIIIEEVPGSPPMFTEQAQAIIDSVEWKDLPAG